MNRKLILLWVVIFACNLGFAQKNKFKDVMSSRKLGSTYKTIKDKDKEEYFQQFFWLKKMEELKAYPHLKGIKPIVLYTFVKEINPPIPSKQLTPEQLKLRKDSEVALGQFFAKKDYENPLVMYNTESYVDPSASKYFTGVNPERIIEFVPKRLYKFTSHNKKSNEEKVYYLWIKDDEYKIVNIFPEEKNTTFFEEVKMYVPDYKISKMDPTVKPGDKKLKSDVDFFYITPFQDGNSNIVYRTEDFKNFEFVKYKKDGGPWTDVEKRKRR